MKTPDPFMMPRLGLALLDRLASLPEASGAAAGRVVVVTSAMRGEGKSFVASALARVLATQCKGPVVLADASVPAIFGPGLGPQAGGLGELLSSGTMPAEGLQNSETAGLWVLARGALVPNRSLFQPAHVAQAFAVLRQRFALSLIDAGTLAECGAMVQEADQSLIVVDARRTAGRRVKVAMAEARLAPQLVAGVVLNRRVPELPRWLGGD